LVCRALASTLSLSVAPLILQNLLSLFSLSMSLCSLRTVSAPSDEVDDDFLIYYLHDRSGQSSLGNHLFHRSVRRCQWPGAKPDHGSGDQLPRPGRPMTASGRVASQQLMLMVRATGCLSMEAPIPDRIFSAVSLCRWCPVSN